MPLINLQEQTMFEIPQDIPFKFAVAVYAISHAIRPDLAGEYWKCVRSSDTIPHALHWIEQLFDANGDEFDESERVWWSSRIYQEQLN